MNRNVILLYLIPLTVGATLATIATGFFGSLSGWGFPLSWKTGGCEQTIGSTTCTLAVYNWLFFAVDSLFYLLSGYALLFGLDRAAPSVVERRTILGTRDFLLIALVAWIIALTTGLIASGMIASPGGFYGQTYGFPLSWKTTLASCPPPCLQANGTFYDWASLVGDFLFYATAAFGMVLYALREPRRKLKLRTLLESVKVFGILALIVVALSAGNYVYDSAYGQGNKWTGGGLIFLDHYSFQNPNVLTLWFRDSGPGTATIVNLYIIDGSGNQAMFPLSATIQENTVVPFSENTTSQGVQLAQGGTYTVRVVTPYMQLTFTVNWS